MIIEKVSLTDWKCYRGTKTFEFDESINFIVGPNGSGKTTMFEAVNRILFDKHSSKSQEIDAIRPKGTNLGPSGEVVFQHLGKRYKAVKRFLQKPISEVYEDHDGNWRKIQEFDAADNFLKDIFGGNQSRICKAENRGIYQALWCLQNEPGIPESVWNDKVHEGLSSMIKLVVKSTQETKFLNRMEEEFSKYWTDTGREVKSSEIVNIRNELDRLRNDQGEILAKLTVLDTLRAKLINLDIRRTQAETDLISSKAEFTWTLEKLDELEKLDQEKKTVELEFEKCQKEYDGYDKSLKEWNTQTTKISEVTSQLLESDRNISALDTQIKAMDEKRKKNTKELESIEPSIEELEKKIETFENVLKLIDMKEKWKIVEVTSKELAELEEELAEMEKQKEDINAPSDKEINEYRDFLKNLERLKGSIEASSINVEIDLGKHRVITTPDIATSETESGNAYVISEKVKFDIENVGSITVWGGGKELKDLVREKDEILEEIKTVHAKYNVNEEDSLIQLNLDANNIIKTIIDKKKALKKKNKGKNAGDNKRLKNDISTLEAQVGPELIKSSRKKVEKEKGETQRQKKDFSKKQSTLQTESEKLNEARNKLTDELTESRENHAKRDSELKSAYEVTEKMTAEYGGQSALKSLISKSKGTLDKTKKALSEIERRCDEELVPLKKAKDLQEKRMNSLEEELDKTEDDILEIDVKLNDGVSEGLYTKAAEHEASIERLQERLNTLERRSQAIKLLRDLMNSYRDIQAKEVAGPLKDILDRWVRHLTDGGLQDVSFDISLRPTEASLKGITGESLPLDALSYGTMEQFSVLTRMGIGYLLSEKERNAIIIDDRLVNSDPLRMSRMRDIIEEVSMRAQVLIATCNDLPYKGLNGKLNEM